MNRLIVLACLFLIAACQENIVPSKKSDLFLEALYQPLLKNRNLPILKNEFFDQFNKVEIDKIVAGGINIWSREALFMRGISEFITIYEVDLKNDQLVINFRYPDQDQIIHESVHFQKQ